MRIDSLANLRYDDAKGARLRTNDLVLVEANLADSDAGVVGLVERLDGAPQPDVAVERLCGPPGGHRGGFKRVALQALPCQKRAVVQPMRDKGGALPEKQSALGVHRVVRQRALVLGDAKAVPRSRVLQLYAAARAPFGVSPAVARALALVFDGDCSVQALILGNHLISLGQLGLSRLLCFGLELLHGTLQRAGRRGVLVRQAVCAEGQRCSGRAHGEARCPVRLHLGEVLQVGAAGQEKLLQRFQTHRRRMRPKHVQVVGTKGEAVYGGT